MTNEEKIEKKKEYDREYRKRNKERISKYKKEWVKNNPDKQIESRIRNRESKRERDKEYNRRNKEKIAKKGKEWAKNNQDKIRDANTAYIRRKRNSDNLYKLKHSIGCMIRESFRRKGMFKSKRTSDIIGCSVSEFKQYIEGKFESWMTWENYGSINGIVSNKPNITWDIDHIIPISSAKTEEEIIKLNHFTNLQPLCSYKNRWVKKCSIQI